MDIIANIIETLNTYLWSYILIGLLLGLGVYFTIITKFVQFTHIGEMFKTITESPKAAGGGKGGVSPFGAFAISAAGRIGTGNLAGVAIAVTLGGPGAVFWMWVTALIGSATAFVESTLAQVYKVKDGNNFRGGPAYYMERGLNARWFGIIFAILIIFTFGIVFTSVQSNTIALAFDDAFNIDRWIIGVTVAVLAGIVVIGGVQRIAKVTSFIVPVMALFYIVLALIIVVINITEIPSLIGLIFSSAFGLNQVVGGGIGAALMNGVRRGLFSNEAGMGSAPNAAASAHVTHPAKQGFVQALGVFFDTIFICSATAFIILLYGNAEADVEGIQLTQDALGSFFGNWAAIFLAIAIFLFCFSSIIACYYYGETNLEFIKENKTLKGIYQIAFLFMVIFGSQATLGLVWSMADLMMALMAITNLVAIALLGRTAVRVLRDYLNQRREGNNPVFFNHTIEGLKNVEAWGKKENKKDNVEE